MKSHKVDKFISVFTRCFRIIELSGGKPPLTYSQFLEVAGNMNTPRAPVPAACSKFIGHGVTPISGDHDKKWGVPTLAELGNYFSIATWFVVEQE